MGDVENEPRLLSSGVVPTPMPKSTLPCEVADPLMALTPEKPTNPSPILKHGVVKVERHQPTDAKHTTVANGRVNRVVSIQNRKQNQPVQACATHSRHSIVNNEWSSASRANPNTTHTRENIVRSTGDKSIRKTQKCVRIEEPYNLKQPQCHTTGIVGLHLESLQREQFDSDTAVLKALQESEMVRTSFAGKVAEGVNRPLEERKYSGLIAVDVPSEEIIAQATGDKLYKVRSTSSIKKPLCSKVSESSVPDILDLFRPDMIAEQPSFDAAIASQQDAQLEGAPANMAFNLYKHMRCWQST